MSLRRLLAQRAVKPLNHVYSQGASASSVAMSKMEPDSQPVNKLYSTMEEKLKVCWVSTAVPWRFCADPEPPRLSASA
jgi:hypothetical protein